MRSVELSDSPAVTARLCRPSYTSSQTAGGVYSVVWPVMPEKLACAATGIQRGGVFIYLRWRFVGRLLAPARRVGLRARPTSVSLLCRGRFSPVALGRQLRNGHAETYHQGAANCVGATFRKSEIEAPLPFESVWPSMRKRPARERVERMRELRQCFIRLGARVALANAK